MAVGPKSNLLPTESGGKNPKIVCGVVKQIMKSNFMDWYATLIYRY